MILKVFIYSLLNPATSFICKPVPTRYNQSTACVGMLSYLAPAVEDGSVKCVYRNHMTIMIYIVISKINFDDETPHWIKFIFYKCENYRNAAY